MWHILGLADLDERHSVHEAVAYAFCDLGRVGLPAITWHQLLTIAVFLAEVCDEDDCREDEDDGVVGFHGLCVGETGDLRVGWVLYRRIARLRPC